MEIRRVGSQPSVKGPTGWFAGWFKAPAQRLGRARGQHDHTHPLGETHVHAPGQE
jgi:hypothetical protein